MKETTKSKPKNTAKARIPLPGKDYDLDLPSGHLSVSQIETMLRCPAQYDYARVQKLPTESSSAAAEGSAMALTINASCVQWSKTGEHLGVEAARSLHEQFVVNEWIDLDEYHETYYGPNDAIVRGGLFIRQFFHGLDLHPVKVAGVLGSEIPFKIKIAGVWIKGIADVVENKSVTDFKVGKSAYFYDPVKSLQLSMYAVAFKKKRVFYCVFEKKTGKILWKEGSRDLQKTKAWLERIVSTVAMQISCRHFPPRPSPINSLCDSRWCDFYKVCFGRSF